MKKLSKTLVQLLDATTDESDTRFGILSPDEEAAIVLCCFLLKQFTDILEKTGEVEL